MDRTRSQVRIGALTKIAQGMVLRDGAVGSPLRAVRGRAEMLRRGKGAATSGATGKVEISRGAIATLVQSAVLESYGVVGMASSGLRSDLARYLRQDDPRRGIEVEVDDDQITITLYVILEYGVRISEVAQNVMASVKFAVERALGMKVRAVNVYVQGLHFSTEE